MVVALEWPISNSGRPQTEMIMMISVTFKLDQSRINARISNMCSAYFKSSTNIMSCPISCQEFSTRPISTYSIKSIIKLSSYLLLSSLSNILERKRVKMVCNKFQYRVRLHP